MGDPAQPGKSPLVYIILAAAAISLVLGEIGDFAINSIVYIFAYRSTRVPIHRMNRLSTNKPLIWTVLLGFFTVVIAFLIPGLRNVLGIVPLSLQEWLMEFGVAIGLLISVEVGKWISRCIHVKYEG